MEHRPSGGAGDTHVAGPAPKPPALDVPGPADVSAPADVQGPAAEAPAPAAEAPGRLLDPAEAGRLRDRWHEVQSGFVDDPREAVRRADGLASDAVDALGHAIAAHRRSLAEAAATDEPPDTERLRLALRGYRDLLHRVIDA
ncbi:hypothetical protein E1264_14490 [Actinomadura sp. KC216]|uniref:hypothetical protein n=1 Tax=Actinomadura sp. KC216 TaxID=2530370 RepID=UPI00104BCE40|nr:hypothetical protein [Actinomadura sp. KC216]TDB87524.1 hypothetical protein E1264_14490 [Actinomadura sp. KC216]